MDLQYGAVIASLHERLYARLDKGIKLAALFFGTFAFATVTAGMTTFTQVLAALIALGSLMSLLFDFAGRAREMRGALRTSQRLLAETHLPSATVAAIEAAIATAGGDAPTVIEGLRKPAFNQNLVTNGWHSKVVPLSKWERFLKLIV